MAVVPYKESTDSKKEQVADMFDNVSKNYDLLNRIMSGGIDIYWRKKGLSMIKDRKNDLIVDIATGTGDLAIEALKTLNPSKIIGVDISEGMLNVGRQKMIKLGIADKIDMQKGDSEKLLFENNTFDTAIVSFGVRNFENLLKGLSDINRVLKPSGTCLILELTKPKSFPFKQLYWLYSTKILPTIGRLISKDSRAYTYLPESIDAFPEGQNFLNIFKQAGFSETSATPLTFGTCTVYIGKK